MNEPDYGVEGVGTYYRASEMAGRMPPKEPGKHRWIAGAAYTLTYEEAARSHEGMSNVLGPEKLVTFSIGCWDCEREYNAAKLDPCPAGDEWSTDD